MTPLIEPVARLRDRKGEKVPPLDITPPSTVVFPEGIKLVHAEIRPGAFAEPAALACFWEVAGRPKYSRALCPPMIQLTEDAYWHDVIHQLQSHLEQTKCPSNEASP